MMGSFGRILRPIFDPGVAVAPPWWQVSGKTCVAAYQPKGAGSLPLSYTNLANPGTYNAAPGVAPTLTADGWTGGGGAYLTTGIIPVSTWTVFCRFSGGSGIAKVVLSADVDVNYKMFGLVPRSGSGTSRVYANGVPVIVSGMLASGVMGLAYHDAYLNGVFDGAITDNVSTPTNQLFILASNENGTPQYFWPGSIQAVAIYSDILTAGEVATVSAAMAAL